MAMRKPRPDGKIENADDKAWKQWFSEIPDKEHDDYLKQLGLDEEDMKEWHEHKPAEKILDSGEPVAEPPRQPGKKKGKT